MEDLVLAHEPDIAWLIALWIAIHGGDPAPEGPVAIDPTTALLATALSRRLQEVRGVGSLTFEALRERLASVGIAVREGEAEISQVEAFEGTRVCTEVPGGRIYCFFVPKVIGPPPGEPGR
ncbi:MAG: hypothetical protein JO153_18275 [Solirubrobacterales bacterium]|nr:hypothetical protein [Solirubrobacterales bacterium]